MWTEFYDLHSGGYAKLARYNEKITGSFSHYNSPTGLVNIDRIYVELSEEDAIIWFYNTFNRHPDHITCYCCGNDYNTYSAETLEELTIQYRVSNNGANYITLEEYKKLDSIYIAELGDYNPEDHRKDDIDYFQWKEEYEDDK